MEILLGTFDSGSITTETQQPVGRSKLKRERSGRERPISTLAGEVVKMPIGWVLPQGSEDCKDWLVHGSPTWVDT